MLEFSCFVSEVFPLRRQEYLVYRFEQLVQLEIKWLIIEIKLFNIYIQLHRSVCFRVLTTLTLPVFICCYLLMNPFFEILLFSQVALSSGYVLVSHSVCTFLCGLQV